MQRICSFGFFLVALLTIRESSAYLLPPTYVLDYMMKKRGDALGLEVKESVEFYDGNFPNGKVAATETVFLRRPRDFRIETSFPRFKQTWVTQGDATLIVTDGRLTHEGRLSQNLMREIFCADKVQDLSQSLAAAGVDLSVISLGRNGRDVVYILGAKEGDFSRPQLWVDKDRFVPARLYIQEQQSGKNLAGEVRFNDYAKSQVSWYPGKIEVYYGGNLAALFRTESVLPRAQLPETLFDLSSVRQKYPAADGAGKGVVISSSRVAETLELLRKYN